MQDISAPGPTSFRLTTEGIQRAEEAGSYRDISLLCV